MHLCGFTQHMHKEGCQKMKIAPSPVTLHTVRVSKSTIMMVIGTRLAQRQGLSRSTCVNQSFAAVQPKPGGLNVEQRRLLIPQHRRKGAQVALAQGLLTALTNAVALQALLAPNLQRQTTHRWLCIL